MAHDPVLHEVMQSSRAEEVRAAGLVAAVGFGQSASRIGQVHRAVADRIFGAIGLPARPVKLAHDAISGGVYAAVRGVGSGVSRAGGTALSVTHGAGAPALSDTRTGAMALGALSGAFGDALERDGNPLAVQMSVRRDGRAVPPASAEMAEAFPDAGPRVAIFTHGLCETEAGWWLGAERHYGDPRVWHGSRLQQDLGHTPVTVRMNTGLHISENGRRLATLIQQVVDSWPVPVEELLLVGHSMGGLINRSACHYGMEYDQRWIQRVRNVVTLGAPHLGAPMEQAAARLGVALNWTPESRPLAEALAQRSVGIKDLRYGAIVDQDWQGRDPDAWGPDPCADIPLLETAAHYVIGATLTRDAQHPLGRVIGDLLVLYPSSSGQSSSGRRVAFEVDNTRHLGGLNHFHLLNHPRVYEQMLEWLRKAPQPAGQKLLPA
jgi:pimeloyl-ACP methyl ester carboxylesterase